jgi:hypothetical protein
MTTLTLIIMRHAKEHNAEILVPEAATMLFSGGFPRSHEPEAVKIIQRAVYHMQ